MTIETLRIQNPNAFLLPELQELVQKAYAQHAFVSFEKAMMELRIAAQIENSAVFVARKGGKFVGLLHVTVPEIEGDAATMSHLYCQRLPAARHALLAAMVGFVREKGYTRVFTIDASKKARAFAKMFEQVGKAKEVGRVYEFNLAESQYGLGTDNHGRRNDRQQPDQQ